jgi:hypothetical protein
MKDEIRGISRKLLQYFRLIASFFLQDHLYVQYVELNQFQNEFRELANKFGENEKIIKKLSVRSESGTVARELRYKLGGGRGSKTTFYYILL